MGHFSRFFRFFVRTGTQAVRYRPQIPHGVDEVLFEIFGILRFFFNHREAPLGGASRPLREVHIGYLSLREQIAALLARLLVPPEALITLLMSETPVDWQGPLCHTVRLPGGSGGRSPPAAGGHGSEHLFIADGQIHVT